MGIDLFGGDFARLEAAAAARERAQAVYSGNIANADTPNYKADRRTFADFLDASLREAPALPMRRSHAGHLRGVSTGSIRPFAHFGEGGDVNRRMDGNSVDLQEEMVKLARNQMMHELAVRLLKGKLNGLQRAIREGR